MIQHLPPLPGATTQIVAPTARGSSKLQEVITRAEYKVLERLSAESRQRTKEDDQRAREAAWRREYADEIAMLRERIIEARSRINTCDRQIMRLALLLGAAPAIEQTLVIKLRTCAADRIETDMRLESWSLRLEDLEAQLDRS